MKFGLIALALQAKCRPLPKLPRRLEAILNLVPRSLNSTSKVADIGADHALLTLALIKLGATRRVVAIDRSAAALDGGRQNLRKATYLDGIDPSSVEFRLGDGFSPLKPTDDVETACIAGMGVDSILAIIEAAPLFPGLKNLVLQPAGTRPQHLIPLRQQLCRSRGWFIQKEDIMHSDGRFYITILASRCAVELRQPPEPLSHLLPEFFSMRGASGIHRYDDIMDTELDLWLRYIDHHVAWCIAEETQTESPVSDVRKALSSAAIMLRGCKLPASDDLGLTASGRFEVIEK